MNSPQYSRPVSRRIIGALGGAGAALAAFVLIGNPATAETSQPVPVEEVVVQDAADTPALDAGTLVVTKASVAQGIADADTVEVKGMADVEEIGDAAENFVFQDVVAEMDAEVAPYFDCIDDQIGEDPFASAIEPMTLTDADWEAMEAAWEAAEAACDELLPAEIKAEWDAMEAEFEAQFEAFDACLAENGVDTATMEAEFEAFEVEFPEPEAGVMVFEADDLGTLVEFGDGDGVITVTKADGALSIATDGDVVTHELGDALLGLPEGLEEAFKTCEAELPQPEFGDDFGIGVSVLDGPVMTMDVDIDELEG